ncbi:hypothetical protein F5Y03DRAFT_368219 [Xylaria venustula]|nr:hypothetical protein F5Y03DRAFT_368219 [Xylaria venustula]
MDPAATLTGYFSTSKRAACERCRKSKQRCPPRASDSEPCERCVRAGAECFTGYTQPLGCINKTNNSRRSQPQQKARQCSLVKTPSLSTSQEWADDEVMNAAMPYLSADACDPHNWEDILSAPVAREELETRNDIFETFLQAAFETDEQVLVDRSCSAIGDGQTLEETSQLQHIPNTSLFNVNSQTADPTPAPFLGHTIDNLLSAAEHDLQLSQLDADLCRQIQTCLTVTKETQLVSLGRTDILQQHQTNSFTNISTDTISNAIGKALCSAQRYVTILQSLTKGSGISGNPGAQQLSFKESHAPLHLLLTYCRVVTLFDCLVAHMHQQLNSSTDIQSAQSAMSKQQTLPDMKFGGFQVQNRGLQVRILIQIIQHQFGLLENILGLPIDLQVTGHRGDALKDRTPVQSLLCGVSIQQLALLDTGCVGSREVLGSVSSLRENLSMLHSLSKSKQPVVGETHETLHPT